MNTPPPLHHQLQRKPFSSLRMASTTGHRRIRKALFVPSLITVVGMFSGFLAILSAFKGHYNTACIAVLLAFVLDGIDGRVARHLNATSAFGREFDSLSDLIAFGVAPAVLAYSWAFSSLADEFGVLVAFLFVACGAARLARFNITVSLQPKRYFEGMPIPAAAFAIVTLVYFHPHPVTNELMTSFVLIYMMLLSALMVSTLPFFSIKHIKIYPANPRLVLLVLSAAVALGWYQHRLMLFLAGVSYVLSGAFTYVHEKRTRSRQQLSRGEGKSTS